MKRLKRLCQCMLISIAMSFLIPVYANNPFGQAIQINTHFRTLLGNPVWLLILRNEESGAVVPYLFDIRQKDNFWVAFAFGRIYRVTVSNLKFDEHFSISNFCGLESGVITEKSMFITLSGDLTPNRSSSQCHILQYNAMPFPIVGQ